jgi:hypothetical protein
MIVSFVYPKVKPFSTGSLRSRRIFFGSAMSLRGFLETRGEEIPASGIHEIFLFFFPEGGASRIDRKKFNPAGLYHIFEKLHISKCYILVCRWLDHSKMLSAQSGRVGSHGFRLARFMVA